MSRFDIDFETLNAEMLPIRLRRPRLLAFLRAVTQPLVVLHSRFAGFFGNTDYALDHNGQVVRLEALLNDAFDADERRIYIEDAPEALPLWLYRRAEHKPVYIHRRAEHKPVYIHRRAESADGPCFIVWVPAFVAPDLNRLRALVDKYRLASKSNYLIKTF